MVNITTEAWVLHVRKDPKEPQATQLKLETFEFPDITEEECLVEPIFGCWEGNMSHALQRRPMDICLQRKEDKVVLGNSGVVRILRCGNKVANLHEGDLCVVFGGQYDEYGFVEKVLAYDAPGTMGLLAKQAKMHYKNLVLIPKDSKHSAEQWAGFSLRYFTAWSNWNLAFKCYRLQITEEMNPHPIVWGWGGGATLAQLLLAKMQGCEPTMITSTDKRLEFLDHLGIKTLDRRLFPNLEYDEEEFMADVDFRKAYLQSEELFLQLVKEKTAGKKVAIFIDYIGTPVTRATLLALSRQGVITTAGWKMGTKMLSNRAVECIDRHIHVNTHFAQLSEVNAAVAFAEANNWLPSINDVPTKWEEIPTLAKEYEEGKVESYYPLFQINKL